MPLPSISPVKNHQFFQNPFKASPLPCCLSPTAARDLTLKLGRGREVPGDGKAVLWVHSPSSSRSQNARVRSQTFSIHSRPSIQWTNLRIVSSYPFQVGSCFALISKTSTEFNIWPIYKIRVTLLLSLL